MKTKKRCAYCASTDHKITREHLFPKSLHKRLQELRSQDRHSFWLSQQEKVLNTEPVINDVCKICNNGILSKLDDYICTLWDKFFSRIHERGEVVDFSYDYHLLCRWFLKHCYNSARIHKSDTFLYLPFIPYILDDSATRCQMRLFLQIVPPGLISVQELNEMGLLSNTPLRWEPEGNRVGFLHFTSNDGRKKLLRAVHLRSYSFFLAFFQPDAKESEINEFVAVLISQNHHVRYLPPESNFVRLICDGTDAWESFRESHLKIIFSNSK